MERQQFTFYRSFLNTILTLPERYQARTAMVLIRYALDEEPPPASCPAAIRTVFEAVRPVLDKARRRAVAGQSGGEASRGGGRPAEEKNKQKTSKEQAKNKPYTGPVTVSVSDIYNSSLFSSVFTALEDAGVQTADNRDEIERYAARFGCERVCEAASKAKARGANSWAYIRTILDNQAAATAPRQHGEQFQRHGEEISPMMREAARKMLEQEQTDQEAAL